MSCQALVFSEALGRRRACRNQAGPDGFCWKHPGGKVSERAAEMFHLRQRRKRPGTDEGQELLLARGVIREIRAYLDEGARKDQLVAALDAYDARGATSPTPLPRTA